MEVREMRCFLRVAETLSFKRAAEILNVSHSVTTKTIAQLEHKIGTPLFTRSTRRVALTPAGVLLQRETAELIRNLDRIQRAVRHETGAASGRFGIGVTPLAMQTLFPPLMRKFRVQHPNLEITVEEISTEAQVKGLLSALIDVALVIAPVSEPELEVEILGEQQMRLAIPTCHPHFKPESGQKVPLCAFATDTFLVSGRAQNGVHEEINRACETAGFRPKIKECNESQTCLALVEAGLGVAFVTDETEVAARPGLKLVNLEEPVPSLTLAMVWRRDDPSTALQTIRKLIAEIT
ncbi:LysR family transcriptional regulator [Gallaecimonas mangrovi]|uniref:LysR family transcriptional regulator n=1 Tax=Gallaecimonas mangrovi TaxID=2291597 RepID=UPI001D02C7E5|nr:LysR substrate-binding domain-containing protein [Gallaecimonas mangrovi]